MDNFKPSFSLDPILRGSGIPLQFKLFSDINQNIPLVLDPNAEIKFILLREIDPSGSNETGIWSKTLQPQDDEYNIFVSLESQDTADLSSGIYYFLIKIIESVIDPTHHVYKFYGIFPLI